MILQCFAASCGGEGAKAASLLLSVVLWKGWTRRTRVGIQSLRATRLPRLPAIQTSSHPSHPAIQPSSHPATQPSQPPSHPGHPAIQATRPPSHAAGRAALPCEQERPASRPEPPGEARQASRKPERLPFENGGSN